MSVRISENLFYVRISETFFLLNGTGISTPVHEPCSFHAWNTKFMVNQTFWKNEHNHEGLSENFLDELRFQIQLPFSDDRERNNRLGFHVNVYCQCSKEPRCCLGNSKHLRAKHFLCILII